MEKKLDFEKHDFAFFGSKPNYDDQIFWEDFFDAGLSRVLYRELYGYGN